MKKKCRLSLMLCSGVTGFTGSETTDQCSSTACCNAYKEIKVDWKTSQSSDFSGEHSSERAVDGSNNQCSHTKVTFGNWWTIDLRGVYNISCVSIFNTNTNSNENENISGAQIYIGNSREKNGTANPLCQNITNFTRSKPNNFSCPANVSGRYVTVFFPQDKPLILCEVKIFGEIKESPFKLIKENKTWADALYYCRDRYETLASIVDEETQTWAELEAENSSTPFVWVGLRYTCTLDFWFWVEDQPVKFTRWGPESKKEECNMSGAIEKQGNQSWSTEWADNNYNFICKKFVPPPSVSL
ncbi:macrophage mannose receptor 1 isoform X3 [Pungitius pungitius]|uniref:macrophage mannose receptor 1 isoform X3 n=1 Tax=Pungitius pungitius TaxID=134920 RepID=UPI002E150078